MDRDLENLQRSVMSMAGIVEEAVYTAGRSLRERDAESARRVIDGDPEIDQMENHVQEECLRVIALHAPVAIDLRKISAVLLITTDLERMGDLATGIAERAIEMTRLTGLAFPIPPRMSRMMESVLRMVRIALDAFARSDVAAAQRVILLDDEVDQDNDAVIDAVLMRMKSSPDAIEAGMALFSAVRHLERIGDHATNIAENVVYMVEGRMVRHQTEALIPRA